MLAEEQTVLVDSQKLVVPAVNRRLGGAVAAGRGGLNLVQIGPRIDPLGAGLEDAMRVFVNSLVVMEEVETLGPAGVEVKMAAVFVMELEAVAA